MKPRTQSSSFVTVLWMSLWASVTGGQVLAAGLERGALLLEEMALFFKGAGQIGAALLGLGLQAGLDG